MKNKSEQNVVVREAVLSDVVRLAILNKEFNGVKIPPEHISDSIRNSSTETVFVAEIDNKVVGFACVQITSSFSSERNKAELTDIYVDKAGRRSGVGSTMFLVVRKYCEKLDVEEIFLRVNRDNKGAIAFYESHGLLDAEHREFRIRYGK